VSSRSTVSSEPEKNFQRALTAHVTGSDGRQPFTQQEEEAILSLIRNRVPWPAFQGLDSNLSKLGSKGFRPLGYHEKRKKGAAASPSSLHADAEKKSKRRRKEAVEAPGSPPPDAEAPAFVPDFATEQPETYFHPRSAQISPLPSTRAASLLSPEDEFEL